MEKKKEREKEINKRIKTIRDRDKETGGERERKK